MKFRENWPRAQNVCKGTPFFWRKRIGRARKRPHKLPSGNGGKDDGAPNIYHKEDSLTALAAPHLKSESFWSLIQYICNLQVNLFQLVHWFPGKYKFTTCCVQILLWMSKTHTHTQLLYTICCELVFWGEFNEQFLVILWVNWWKNKSFWQRFTCKKNPTLCTSFLWTT